MVYDENLDYTEEDGMKGRNTENYKDRNEDRQKTRKKEANEGVSVGVSCYPLIR